MGAVAAVYGKHPEFGDFIAAGLDPPLTRLVEGWLNGALGDLRVAWAEGWPGAFDRGVAVRFWIGPGLAGQSGFAGVMIPSRDRVGRRFPLVAGLAGSGLPPPPSVDPDQGLYARIEAFLPTWRRENGGDGGGAVAFRAALMQALDAGPAVERDGGDDAVAATPVLWARHAGGDVDRLWSDAALADHHAAALGRAYLWIAGTGGTPAAMFADNALPGAAVLGWLMTGAPPLRGQAEDGVDPETVAATDAAQQTEPTSGHVSVPAAHPAPSAVAEVPPEAGAADRSAAP